MQDLKPAPVTNSNCCTHDVVLIRILVTCPTHTIFHLCPVERFDRTPLLSTNLQPSNPDTHEEQQTTTTHHKNVSFYYTKPRSPLGKTGFGHGTPRKNNLSTPPSLLISRTARAAGLAACRARTQPSSKVQGAM